MTKFDYHHVVIFFPLCNHIPPCNNVCDSFVTCAKLTLECNCTMLQQIYTCKDLNNSCIKMSHSIDGSLGKKVKREGAIFAWVEPLYGKKKPKIIFDKKNVVSRT